MKWPLQVGIPNDTYLGEMDRGEGGRDLGRERVRSRKRERESEI